MNKLILVGTLLLIALANVECLKKNSVLDSGKGKLEEVEGPHDGSGSFLEADSETTAFSLNNFYEYVFYVQAYEYYNMYYLNTGLSCGLVKKQYWYTKKLDVISISNFCYLIGSQIGSSYLSTYLCAYILNLKNWYNNCSY